MRQHWSVVVTFAAILLFFGYPHLAAGQPNYPDCVGDAACRALYEGAREQSTEGHLAEALRLYGLAFDTKPDPRLLFSMARLHHRLGQTAQAAPYYQRFLDSAFENPEQKSMAREYLAQIQSKQQTEPQSAASSGATRAAQLGAKPVYKKWWFWTAIGGGVAAGLAIGLGVGLLHRDPLSDVTTLSATF